MKKILLPLFLSIFILGSTLAQFNYTTNANIGHKLLNINTFNKDTLIVDFNTAIVNSTWAKAKAAASLGKDSVVIKKCQTQKGMQALIYTDGTLTTSIQSGNFKCASYTGNGNPVHVASMDSLLKIMAKSAYQTAPYATINGSAADSLTAPAHCLFDNGSTTNQVYGVYPGKYKHIEYGFYISLSGKTLTDDITFDLGTFNTGTTGKTATYELTVYAHTSTISAFSPIGTTTNDTYLLKRISNFYVTGDAAQTVNLSTITGLAAADFTNKYVYIFLKTLGTSNASSVVDGAPNTATNKVPDVYDPTIYFDNFKVIYAVPSWITPAAVQNSYLNHNNGTVTTGSATDFSGGQAVDVIQNLENTIKFYLTDIKRSSTLTITEANDGGGPNLKYYFAPTGAIKAKSGNAGFITDVNYTFTPSDGSTKFLLTIPAPTPGTLANDTLEVSIGVKNVAWGTTSTERLEINNGIRFYYTMGAFGTGLTEISDTPSAQLRLSSFDNILYVSNAIEPIIITNIAGQRIKVSSATDASKGIHLQSGLYIVKSGNLVQKVIVK